MESSILVKKKKMCGEEDDQSNWCNVHEDILLLIKSKLYFRDQLRFKRVCRGWHSVSPTTCVDQHLPWVLGFRFHMLDVNDEFALVACNLYDPIDKRVYMLNHAITSKLRSRFPPHIYASKQGWVFLGVILDRDCKFFAYNAFTMRIIELPDMRMSLSNYLTVQFGAFSTNPACPDCVFYHVFVDCLDDATITISTYCFNGGGSSWTVIKVQFPHPTAQLDDIVYMNGLLYCLFDVKYLWTYDSNSRDWRKMEIDASAVRFETCKGKLIQVDEQRLLLLIFKPYWYELLVFKLDWSSKAWIKHDDIRKQAILVGEASTTISIIETTKSLCGRLYSNDRWGPNLNYFFENMQIPNGGCNDNPFYRKNMFNIWVEPPMI